MKKLFFLLLFCFHIQAQELDTGVDVVFMDLTGYSTLNVFLIDVDNPDSKPIQFSDNVDFASCIDETNGSDEAFAACEALDNPPYLGIWQIDFEDDYFYLENLETGESERLYFCEYSSAHCNYQVSSDGRWLAFNSDAGLMLVDLASLGEAQVFPIIGSETYTSLFFWLENYKLLYWHNELNRYFIYDTETALHYPLESVLDRENLTINVEGAEGLLRPPEPSEVVEPPDEIRGFAYMWDWRSDGTVLYGSENTVSFWDGESSEDLFSIPGEYDEAADRGGWHITQLLWSEDETALIAGFWELNAYHEPNHYWLYEMQSGELREVFAGDWAQWLR